MVAHNSLDGKKGEEEHTDQQKNDFPVSGQPEHSDTLRVSCHGSSDHMYVCPTCRSHVAGQKLDGIDCPGFC